MSRLDRAVGLVRSLAVYHAIPFRQARMRAFYRQFVDGGRLVFDIGAHAGNRTRAFASLGCTVIAFEPQPDFARVLRVAFQRAPRVQVVEQAVADASGRATLSVSERTPTVSTLSAAWRAARADEAGFDGVVWNRQLEIETTTLDQAIERFGAPGFIKIDVEGGEPAVLAGLSRPVDGLSFEYLPGALDQVGACVAHLTRLAAGAGEYQYNWSPGESYRLASTEWLDGARLLAALAAPEAQRRSGDVYARFTPRS